MAEHQPSSRRPRQSRQSAIPVPHNSDEAEFSANQPLNSVGAASVHSIPINPRLQMHSMFFFVYSTNLDRFFFSAACLRERDERAARKAAKKAAKAQQTNAAMAQQTQAAAIQPQPQVALSVTQNSQFYPQLHLSSATPVFRGSNLTLPPHTNVIGWNQNQYVGPQPESSSLSNDIQPWTPTQHQAHQSSTGNQNIIGNVVL